MRWKEWILTQSPLKRNECQADKLKGKLDSTLELPPHLSHFSVGPLRLDYNSRFAYSPVNLRPTHLQQHCSALSS